MLQAPGSPASDNTIFSIDSGRGGIVGLGSIELGNATSRTFLKETIRTC